ncbi:carboxymuconolactone decarboxylase family protein [Halioxenophilus sp. WMMB6]|uniref:carboxymuconolactone decarboxylase family protein n=1 Tax=Halioxenophilus sp. WMMB6 TaxID=3073815 RepID=UPI00295ED9CB|nr:carboxymuconolactone decarboxylase family protein [Halioxenophilus sp. WMMB6]
MTKPLSYTPDAVAARNAAIMEQPPRLPANRTEAVLAPARAMMAQIAGAASGQATPVPDEHIPEMLLTAMCHQELFERVVNVSLQLLKNPSLPLRDRQLVILRTGWLRQIPYIFGEHVSVSKKLGLTDEDIEQVIVGSASPHWSEHEKALLEATEQIVNSAMVTDEVWQILAKSYNHPQLFELPVLIGQFSTVGYFQNVLRIPLSPSNPGLTAR